MSFLVSKDLEQSYTTLSGTLSDKQRSQALEVLSKSKSSDAARLIVEMFRLTSLVPLKCQLVRSLGSFSDGRTIDFLYRLAFQKSDLIVAREAILTLGQVKHPLAIEILCFFLMSEEFPFQREVLHALGSAEVLTIQDELLSIFPRMKAEASDQRALQTYLIVLAKHGVRDIEEDLLSLLRTATQVQDSGALLNSCLLAACGLGSEIVKVALEELDLEDKTFSAELKNTVVRAVEDRLGLSLEDVVLGLTGRNRKEAVSFSLAKLRRFSADRIEEAIRAFGNEFDEETFLWLKIESFQISDQASCVQFLKQLISQGKPFQIALFAKRVKKFFHSKVWKKILAHLSSGEIALMGECLIDKFVHESIIRSMKQICLAKNLGVNDGIITRLCNSLVYQSQLCREQNLLDQSLELLEQLSARPSLAYDSRARLVRAIGQLGFSGRVTFSVHVRLVEYLSVLLAREPQLRGSIFHALGNLVSKEAGLFLVSQLASKLEQCTKSDNASSLQINEREFLLADMELILSMLCLYPRELLQDFNLNVSEEYLCNLRFKRYALRLAGLGFKFGEAIDELIVQALLGSDFCENLLGLDACLALSHSGAWQSVLCLASSPNETIRGLALENICRSKNGRLQDQLVEFIVPEAKITDDLLLRCFDLFEVDENDPPLNFATQLLECCRAEEYWGPFMNANVRHEALCLSELILYFGAPKQTAVAASLELGGVDRSLVRDLPHFETYSETLKTVLRNSELIFCHPEIFDDRVDKSTSIIELVKSIDLLLQEKVGEPLFLGSRPEVLAKLRTRVAMLGLQESQLDNSDILRLLGAHHIFTPELFPSIKLGRMVQSIQAGRFITEQLRILDGLKGWAVFLLLFARSYCVAGNMLESVIEVTIQPEDCVAKLAWEMILLQERRNIAAHRGTILDINEIKDLRQQAIRVLFTIDSLFLRDTKKQTDLVKGVA